MNLLPVFKVIERLLQLSVAINLANFIILPVLVQSSSIDNSKPEIDESTTDINNSDKHFRPTNNDAAILINDRNLTRRDVSRFEEDEVGWSNINEEVDMALDKIWLLILENGYSTLTLPDMQESISVRPFFITYSAGLRLFNGHLYNMQGLKRSGNSYMTYTSDKTFDFRLNILISNLQFVYDFGVNIIVEAEGAIEGSLEDTLVSGEFSISAENANLKLKNFQIISFGNINVRLKHNSIIKHISGAILGPITNLFRDRITTSISESIKDQLERLMEDINKEDKLELRKFLNKTLSGLTG